MVQKLFASLTSSVAIGFLLTNQIQVNSQEYVFSAPPEVDRQLVEIPAQEEYPLDECSAESAIEPSTPLDSHDCNCVDCEDLVQDSETSGQLSLDSQPNSQ
ncbi:MAG TPA: hypothetical protein V6C71_14315 [Coleofasciculaceae cyanobacterium]|jgi:hypothetical protein